ncbi:hypothetical protein FOA24_32555 [Bacillus thuringiensis]|uniref:hypothetical protein n=1 Tax=Bacillus thuringiensis TaxID=1428 RepID=UPI003336ECEC
MNTKITYPTNFIILTDYQIIDERIFPTQKALEDYCVGKYTIYNPMTDEQVIYMEMNKVDYGDSSSVLKFVKKFGLPYSDWIGSVKGYDTVKENLLLFPEALVNGVSTLIEDVKINTRILLHSVYNISIEDAHLKYVLLYEDHYTPKSDINTYRINELEMIRYLLNTGHFTNMDKQKILAQSQSLIDSQKEVVAFSLDVEKKPIIPALQNLIRRLDSNVFRYGTEKLMINNGAIQQEHVFKNLFQVANYQLKQAILTNAKFEICPNCGHHFEVQHKNQRFCPPLPGRKRSTCENTYNQRLKRKRKKEQTKG